MTEAISDPAADAPEQKIAGSEAAVLGPMDDLFPVYEWAEQSEHPRQHLVMTPWMLLDCLKACQDDTYALLTEVYRTRVGEEQRYGIAVNPVADQLEKIQFGLAHILKVLWRGGLWTEADLVEVTATDGKTYLAIREPFTLGKPGSRALPPDAPAWQRELLGVPLPPQLELTDPPSSTDEPQG
ncbi:MAG: hypothetical protein H7Z41_07570 [Cytophagales bacterium]|nr:hypothetical protein [Armatimonadota bacterium]